MSTHWLIIDYVHSLTAGDDPSSMPKKSNNTRRTNCCGFLWALVSIKHLLTTINNYNYFESMQHTMPLCTNTTAV